MPAPRALSAEERETLRHRARLAGRRKRHEWLIMGACILATITIGLLFMRTFS